MNTNKRKQEINKWKLDKTNEELERRIKNENLLDLRIQHR